MATLRIEYGTSTALTITLASLAPSATAGRESTAVDNSSNKYLDVLAQVKVTLAAGTPASDKKVYVLAYGSEDGTTYTDNATGTNAAITLTEPTGIRVVCEIPTPSGGTSYESQPFAVARAFPGAILPRKWGLVVVNNTNVALSSTAGDHAASYSGIRYTVA